MTPPLETVRIGVDVGQDIEWHEYSSALAEIAMHQRPTHYAGQLYVMCLKAANLGIRITVSPAGNEVSWEIRCATAAAAIKTLVRLQRTPVPQDYRYNTEGDDPDEPVTFSGDGRLPDDFIERLMMDTQ